MRLRTVNSIILPSAHKVKASARNSVTTVVGGGGRGERGSGGLLKESPEPPRTFLEFFIGGGGVAVPKGGLPPAGGVPLRGTGLTCRCGALWGGCPRAALAIPAPGERTISNAEVPLPRSPLSLAAGTVHQCRVLTATPPPGTANARRAGNAGGQAPLRAPAWQGL